MGKPTIFELFACYKENPGAEIRPLEHVHWGPEFLGDEVKEILDARYFRHHYGKNIAEVTAQLLTENKTER
jgi:hypothetical protein